MTDPRDGRIYKTIEIGSKVWLAENLNFSDTTLLKACYDDNVKFCDKYGGLYNWKDAMRACPSGWHLPSKDEYDQLLNAAGANGKDRYIQLREGGQTNMNLLLGGWIHKTSHETFWSLEKAGMYWTSTEKGRGIAYALILPGSIKTAKISDGDKDDSRSVRCVKD
jgi:uncharacterized protein (TIGR02145 family)